MAAIAYKAVKKFDEAVFSYSQVSFRDVANRAALLFNKALAFGAQGSFDEARTTMKEYIELENPSWAHISRVLYNEWKVKGLK